jgi:hypothetical protein
LSTSYYFEYGATPALGQVSSSFALPGGTEYQNVSGNITGLQSRQTYYYRLRATNSFASATTEAVSFYTAVKPVILSFSPASATIGTEVSLVGQNFNASPEKNVVSFGATRGIVLSSSPTEIKVKVPAGASLGSVTLLDTESGLSTESAQEFVPTFTAAFKKDHIRLTIGFNDTGIRKTSVEDMDGDGKPDIVAAHYEGFYIYQNVSQGGELTAESFQRDTHNLTDLNGIYEIWLYDLDGNGLKDVIVQGSQVLRIFPNLSVPGYIFFAPPVDLPVADLAYFVFEDFDLDGHVDIGAMKFVAGGTKTFTIIRNQNPKGSMKASNFESRSLNNLNYYLNYITASDLNNDGAPDVIIASYLESTRIFHVLKNNSRPGIFDFDDLSVPDVSKGNNASYVAHDLNQDGWKDIISHSPDVNGNVGLFKNKGTSPNITFAEPAIALSGYTISGIKPGDIDGDGKTDLLAVTKKREFLFLKNSGAAGDNLTPSSFEYFSKYGMNTNGGNVDTQMTVNDLNGDGRPEIINVNAYYYGPRDGYLMEIWQNLAPDCLDPSLVKVVPSNNGATIKLPGNTTLDQFEIDYTPADYEYWQRLSSTTIDYISAGLTYTLRVRAKCYLGFTDYYYVNFIVDCVNTASFSISTIGVDNVQLSPYDLGSFEVQYSVSGQDQWETLPPYTNQITNLSPGTHYDLRFRGHCYKPGGYTYREFTTLCPKMTALSVTDLAYNSAVVSWSSDYTGDAVLEYSDDNTTWTTIDKSLALSPLIPATHYFVRGRMACTDTLSDYSLAQFTTPCPKISTVSYDEITPFSATATWIDESNTGSYTLTYSIMGGKSITVQTRATTFHLNDLTPGTQYSVSITPACTGPGIATLATFNTVCYVPFDLSASDVSYSTAELSWNDDFNGLPYAIDYSISGSHVWKTTEASFTHITLQQLRPGTKYEARVHINCTSITAPYASVHFDTKLYEETTFSPNPTDSKITIYPSKNLIGSQFSLYDNVGKVLAHGELLDYTIDLSAFSYGIYTLQVEGEKPMRIVKR